MILCSVQLVLLLAATFAISEAAALSNKFVLAPLASHRSTPSSSYFRFDKNHPSNSWTPGKTEEC